MRKVFLISLFFLVSYSCTNKFNYTEEKLGFILPKSVKMLESKSEFANNPTGDGTRFVELEFDKSDSLLIFQECIRNNYSKLPINQNDLPDGAIYHWVNRNDSVGYYRLDIDTFDNTSYSISVINMSIRKIIIYTAFY